MVRSDGRLFILSSPSGGGKSTIIATLRDKDESLCYSVSATTRLPRKGEKEGRDYFFISKEQFLQKVKVGAFIEWAEVHGNYYGTFRDQIERCIHEGKKVLLDIDVQGGLQLKSLRPESVLIFIQPPSVEELEKRLHHRGTESEEIIAKRIKIAQEEMQLGEQYDFQIVNFTLEETIKAILTIIHSDIRKIN